MKGGGLIITWMQVGDTHALQERARKLQDLAHIGFLPLNLFLFKLSIAESTCNPFYNTRILHSLAHSSNGSEWSNTSECVVNENFKGPKELQLQFSVNVRVSSFSALK